MFGAVPVLLLRLRIDGRPTRCPDVRLDLFLCFSRRPAASMTYLRLWIHSTRIRHDSTCFSCFFGGLLDAYAYALSRYGYEEGICMLGLFGIFAVGMGYLGASSSLGR